MDNRYFIGKYYLHDHSKKIAEKNDLDIDEGSHSLCGACMLPIFSTLYQTDEAGRCFHRCCSKLPKLLIDHPIHMNEPLHLHDQSLRIAICNQCLSRCEDFYFYQCGDASCRFTLDVLCAGTTRVKILHRSHMHELDFVRNKSKSWLAASCGACDSKVDGEFYWCRFCDFYIHRSCASLPNAILHKDHHQHALTLMYHLGWRFLEEGDGRTCSICHERLSTVTGTYICMKCYYKVHIKCAISDPDSFQPVPIRDIVDGLIHLPMPNERTCVRQYLLENNRTTTEEERKEAIENLHDHPLIFHTDYGEGSSQSSSNLCDACIRPISPPFYSCPQCDDFYLHKSCANLPLHINQNQAHSVTFWPWAPPKDCNDISLALCPRLPSQFFGIFYCDSCRLLSNGFLFQCDKCLFQLDVGCAVLPKAISHGAHGKSHILLLTYGYDGAVCHCCNSYSRGFSYACGTCPNFRLDAKCALLPLSVEHKFDRHPLTLTTSGISTSGKGENFCEICEEDINAEGWYYQCKECITLFHIKCIPCVAESSKIKFGGTIHVKCHNCPLTSVRLLTSYSYTCSLCKETIHGRKDGKTKDGIAFECIECCFWLHYECAKKEWNRD